MKVPAQHPKNIIEPPTQTTVDIQAPAEHQIASPQAPAPANDDSIPTTSLEDVLLKHQVITKEQIDQARAESINTGLGVVELLIKKSLVTEEQVAKAKAEYFSIDFVKLSEIGASPEALNVISEGIAQRYLMLPFALEKDSQTLSVAMANPLDLRAIDFVEKKTGYHIKPFLTTKTNLGSIITERYSQSLSSEVKEALQDTTQVKKKVVDVKEIEVKAEKADKNIRQQIAI